MEEVITVIILDGPHGPGGESHLSIYLTIYDKVKEENFGALGSLCFMFGRKRKEF